MKLDGAVAMEGGWEVQGRGRAAGKGRATVDKVGPVRLGVAAGRTNGTRTVSVVSQERSIDRVRKEGVKKAKSRGSRSRSGGRRAMFQSATDGVGSAVACPLGGPQSELDNFEQSRPRNDMYDQQ